MLEVINGLFDSVEVVWSKQDIDRFLDRSDQRAFMIQSDFDKLKDHENDLVLGNGKINIGFVILGLDFGNEGCADIGQIKHYKHIYVQLYSDIQEVEDEESGTKVKKGRICHVNEDAGEEWIKGGKHIFTYDPDSELVPIPTKTKILQANFYIYKLNEEYLKEQEELKRLEQEKKLFEIIEKNFKSISTPFIKVQKNEEGVEKQTFTFSFMDHEVKIFAKNRFDALVMSNYLFELNANPLFQGMLDISNLKYISFDVRGIKEDEYMDMLKYESLDHLYGLVKNRISYVINNFKLDKFISKDLKNFLKQNPPEELLAKILEMNEETENE